MKVIMIIRMLHYSGAPRMFLWLARKLSESGHKVTILTWCPNNNAPNLTNITYISEDLTQVNFFSRVIKIRRHIKESDADFSISFLLDSNVYNTLACILLRTKSIICERNDPYKPNYYKLKILKPILKLASGAVFQLKRVSEFYNFRYKPTAVIPNPVINNNQICLKPFNQRKNIITTLGRLDIFQKRTDLLLHAFAKFYQYRPEYTLRLIGDGPDEQALRTLASDLCISHAVQFVGSTNTPINLIEECKIFVLSSDFEGIPNALIEAMSIGLPCVATDCSPGGAAMLIKHNINGILVPRANVEKLFKSILFLSDNPAIADRLGLEAKKISSLLNEDIIIQQWNNYLESINNKTNERNRQ